VTWWPPGDDGRQRWERCAEDWNKRIQGPGLETRGRHGTSQVDGVFLRVAGDVQRLWEDQWEVLPRDSTWNRNKARQALPRRRQTRQRFAHQTCSQRGPSQLGDAVRPPRLRVFASWAARDAPGQPWAPRDIWGTRSAGTNPMPCQHAVHDATPSRQHSCWPGRLPTFAPPSAVEPAQSCSKPQGQVKRVFQNPCSQSWNQVNTGLQAAQNTMANQTIAQQYRHLKYVRRLMG
jgi:hypothetical protein